MLLSVVMKMVGSSTVHRLFIRHSSTILAFESSADDTCCAVLRDNTILANVVIKQHSTHETYGGIHPLFAQQLHQKNLPAAIRQASEPGCFGASSLYEGTDDTGE